MPAPTDTPWIIRATDVGKSYAHAPALVGANLTVGAGESVAIMGPAARASRRSSTCSQGSSPPTPAL